MESELLEAQERIEKYASAGEFERAIAEGDKAIESAVQSKRDEDACYLYARVAGIYFKRGDTSGALATLKRCEERFPQSVLARFLLCERLFWYARDYRSVVGKAESILVMVRNQPGYYHQTLHLKGLAHFELGEMDEAVSALRQTEYYDLSLVEKLVHAEVGHVECKNFLDRAQPKYLARQAAGEDVSEHLRKLHELQDILARRQ